MKATFNNPNAVISDAGEIETDWSSPGYQAFRILQLGFVAAPILAGLDKFFHLLVNWDQYVPAFVAQFSPFGVHQLMMVVGVIEIVAGVGVATYGFIANRDCLIRADLGLRARRAPGMSP